VHVGHGLANDRALAGHETHAVVGTFTFVIGLKFIKKAFHELFLRGKNFLNILRNWSSTARVAFKLNSLTNNSTSRGPHNLTNGMVFIG